MFDEKCSCSKRDKEKCVEESSSGCGKMCVRESIIPASALNRMDEAHDEFKVLVCSDLYQEG